MSLFESNFSTVLDGVRVLDLSRGLAGAFCGHALAQLGASVVALRPDAGWVEDSDAAHMAALDGLKRHVVLDCYEEGNRNEVARMCADAALVIEDRPYYGWPLGMPLASWLIQGESALTAICISPFGLTGPNADYVAEPLTTYHSGGHAQQIPSDPLWPDYLSLPPLQAGGYWGESQCGLLAAIAALAAIAGSGKWAGHIIDCAKQEALIQMHWTEIARYPNSGRNFDRLKPNITYVGGILPASDGYVQVVAMEEHQWAGLIQLFGSPDWMMTSTFATQAGRLENYATVAALLANETRRRSKQQLYVEGQALGVPIAPVTSLGELNGAALLVQRGVFADVGDGTPYPRWDGSVFTGNKKVR